MTTTWDRCKRLAFAGVAASGMTSVWGWFALPDGPIATHFDAAGEADGFSSKPVALLVLPAVSAVLVGMLTVAPRFEPRVGRELREVKVYRVGLFGVSWFLAAIHLMVVLVADGRDIDPARVVAFATGLLFILVGNYLPKTPSNWFAGVRTPWTLTSERSWRKTHRVAGRGFVISGAIAVMASLLDLGGGVIVSIAAIGLVSLAATAYSYVVWRSDPDRGTA